MINAVFVGGPLDGELRALPKPVLVYEIVGRFCPYCIEEDSLTEPQPTVGHVDRYYRDSSERLSRVVYVYRWEHMDGYEMLRALLEWYARKAEMLGRKLS